MWVYILLCEEGVLNYPYKLSHDWQGITLTLSELKAKAIKCGYDTEFDNIPDEEPEKPDRGLLEIDCNLGSIRYDRFEDGKVEYVLWREWMEV